MTSAHSFADLCKEDLNKEDVTPLDLGEGSLDLEIKPNKEALAFPPLTPIMDTVDGFRNIDWKNVREQARGGLNNVGIVIAIISEKTHELGIWLAQV
jgi:hypothetical protein